MEKLGRTPQQVQDAGLIADLKSIYDMK